MAKPKAGEAPPTPLRATIAQAKGLQNESGRLSALVFKHGTMQLRWYAPPAVDSQVPHTQDELYIVARGAATFVVDGGRVPCGPGDVLFAKAGAAHRFEEMAPEFATWVVFWGPQGGEQP